jgi:phosphoribosylamine---glycine ligase
MKILLIGSGGREHAMAWKLSESERVARIIVAPGNGGTAGLPRCRNVAIDAEDLAGLLRFAQEEAIDLTVVGPEAPLVAGLVDLFEEAGLAVFGPQRHAAQLEGSKAFSKEFMQRHAIPTGRAEIFTGYEAAARFVKSFATPPVIKASGLAAGKGVVLPQSLEEAKTVLRQMLVERQFGEASATVLVEERLSGPELSVLAFCDGKTARIMPPAQDHKRLLDGDQGPNTGGMGAFAPSPLATAELLAEVEARVLQPTLDGIAAEGAPYMGVLYVGLMLTPEGPRVLEFNCRFGDPETQVILPLLESDLLEVLLACTRGKLAEIDLAWRDAAAVTVVMASGGYPGVYAKGKSITGIDVAGREGCLVFHAGTALSGEQPVTNGGRVLNVTAVGERLSDAVEKAYCGLAHIHFDDATFRRDIGRNAAGG